MLGMLLDREWRVVVVRCLNNHCGNWLGFGVIGRSKGYCTIYIGKKKGDIIINYRCLHHIFMYSLCEIHFLIKNYIDL